MPKPKPEPAKKTETKQAKQAPFEGLLAWVRSNLGEDEAAAIEHARDGSIDGLRAQLAAAQAKIRTLKRKTQAQ